MATENIVKQEGGKPAQTQNANASAQKNKRRYPYKKHYPNKNTKENQNAAQSVKKDSEEAVPVQVQPPVVINENNKNKPRNTKNKTQNGEQNRNANSQNNQNPQSGQNSRNAQNKQRSNQRKKPQVHYDHDNIKMLPNNYISHQEETEAAVYSGYAENDGNYDAGDNIMSGTEFESEDNTGAVIGRNAVRELLKSNRSIDKLFVRRGDREGSILVIVAEAVNRHIPVVEVDSLKLDDMSGGAPHQGVVAMAAEKEYTDIDDMLRIAEQRGETPLIVIADEIADPYNLGALIRCAECAGAHGLVIPKRRAAGLTPVVTKASAGAIEHLAIAKVTNIGNTIEQLKKKGLWIYAAEAGGTPYYDTDFSSPAAIVFGSEGNGIGKLIMGKCDFVVSIPMYGHVNSLNVSTAASVILSHAARMQRQK